MRVLVAGATSVAGLPLLRELNARGRDVVGLTRQSAKAPQIEQAGAKPVVADVFNEGQIDAVVADIEPEVVISLLTTLPRRGPMRVKDFEPARALWGRGAPSLVVAAQRAGVRRIVAATSASYPPRCTGRSRCRCRGGYSGSSHPTARSRSACC